MLDLSIFAKGSFPMRYLGLPLSPKKWSKMECHQLIVKITERIRNTAVRHLSYAGKLQIINSVLFLVHNFWGAVFILPQSVVNEVHRKCREFLWGSSEEKKKIALVAWVKICKPKKQGGLNIKRCRNCNKASVGKLIWQIMEKKDTLWVKWIHGLYMKEEDFGNHVPQVDSSWYWKRLNKLKLGMVNWYRNGKYGWTKNGKYSVMKGYIQLVGETSRMENAELIWNNICLPKHIFIMWLAVQNRLLTQERLLSMGIHCGDSGCSLCGEDEMESADHLFSKCEWSVQIWKGLTDWCGIKLQ